MRFVRHVECADCGATAYLEGHSDQWVQIEYSKPTESNATSILLYPECAEKRWPSAEPRWPSAEPRE